MRHRLYSSCLFALFCAALPFLAPFGCGPSPTEPTPVVERGYLKITVQAPCASPGQTRLLLPGVGELGPVATPGDTIFSVPVGSYRSYTFCRELCHVFTAIGPVFEIRINQTTVLAEPLGVCGQSL